MVTAIFILFFGLVVGVPAVAMTLYKQEQIARRNERMGIYDGPVQRFLTEPDVGPHAYGEGDQVQLTNGTTDYSTVLYVRTNPLQGKGTQVTVRNNRTGVIRTAHRNTWKKAELTW